jgi:(p)ppGpp synthase/HD superfamily hydrolase
MATELILGASRAYRALLIAEAAHRGQTRKGSAEPYIVHPMRVMALLAAHGYDDDVLAAGALHDVVEDTAVTHADLAADGHISAKALGLVHLVTKWWSKDTNLSQHAIVANTREYYERILTDADASALKVADRTDNLRDMRRLLDSPTVTSAQRAWAERYRRQTLRAFEPFRTVPRIGPLILLLDAALRAVEPSD